MTHLECGLTGQRHEADRLQGLSRAGKPLLVRYDLDSSRNHIAQVFAKTLRNDNDDFEFACGDCTYSGSTICRRVNHIDILTFQKTD